MSPNRPLPRSSRQETLETVSRHQLALKFDPDLFELRPEDHRDKGIDVIGEIKQDGAYTNFRFAIQLKSTESVKKQADGSLSFPIAISNLCYLLNLSLPAYYILYDYPENQFYITTIAEVMRALQQKYKPDQLPKTYNVKFSHPLDQEQIDGIYKEAFENGMLLKKLGIHLKMSAGKEQLVTGLVIDESNDVYSVEQNIAFIEQFGYQLLNSQRFSQVVEIEQRTYPRSKATPTFNMICGFAYFHQANLYKAIELLKLAHDEIESLHPEHRNMVSYTLLQAKYLLGMVNAKTFNEQKSKFLTNEDAGTFLQLENLAEQFYTSKEPDMQKRIKTYYENTLRVIDQHPDFHDMRVVGYAKILNVVATLLMHELAKNSVLALGRGIDAYRDRMIAEWSLLEKQFCDQLRTLYEYALKHQNFLAVNNLSMERIEWDFRKVYHFHALINWNRDTLSIDPELSEYHRKVLNELLEKEGMIAESYDRIQHRENHFNTLRTQYELYDLLGDQEGKDKKAAEMQKLINTYDLNALQTQFDSMLSGEMRHRQFLKEIAKRKAAIDKVAKNSGFLEILYSDFTPEMNAISKRAPEWSLRELFPFYYPD